MENMIARFFKSLIPSPKSFSKIILETQAIEDIIEFAHTSHPKEFIAVLQGKVRDNALRITGLLYQPYSASRSTSVVHLNLPIISDAVGSVHGHPSGSSRPSRADLSYFAKHGLIHIIIAFPYTRERIACYDSYGRLLKVMFDENK
jgi:proteasome lid subunit RPN8/RPN11